MISRIQKRLAGLAKCSSGNAALMTAIGLPALIGAAGYGIDTAQWYMWKRELQHSVDQAAIAGAWALAYDEDTDSYILRAQQDFAANQNVTADFDSQADVSLANYAGGIDNSVLVTATASKALPFSSVLFQTTATVRATAQAAFREGSSYNACLITLKDDGTTFEVGGNANVNANCGLGALSCDEDAIVIDGSATVTTTSIAACGTVSVPPDNQGAVAEGVTGLSDIYASTPIPEPEDDTPDKEYYCPKKNEVAIDGILPGTAYPSPGVYDGGITVKCNTFFQPGIYYIDGGTLDLSANATVTGYKVMFVLREGATLKLGGSGGNGSIQLTPMQVADFVGTSYQSDAAKLADMLFIEDKSGEDSAVDHIINGNSRFNIEGVLYLPNGNVQINGDSGTTTELCFQISAWTLDIRGSANLKTLCDYDSSSELGSSTPEVRLIA